MATLLRKRKIVDTHYGDHSSTPSQRQPQPRRPVEIQPRQQQLGIARFARLRKATGPAAAKDIERDGEEGVKKRKLQHAEIALDQTHDEKPAPVQQPARPVTPPPARGKATRQRLPPSQPGEARRIAPIKRRAGAPIPESPTQGARAILEAFVIAGPRNEPSKRDAEAESKDVAPRTGSPEPTEPASKSHDLTSLHAAFLSALALHYAHAGTATPADVSAVAGSVARLWGRRRVSAEDVRMVLGVQQWSGVLSDSMDTRQPNPTTLPTLTMVDFGRGRLGIEYDGPASSPTHGHAPPLPIAALKRIFAQNLLRLNGTALPLAPVVPFLPTASSTEPSETVSTTAQGSTRLAALKASALNAQANAARSDGLAKNALPAATASPSSTASFRGASLLARITAKATLAAAQPAAPSATALARTAALQRLRDVIPILEVLVRRSDGTTSAAASSQRMGTSTAAADLAADLGLSSTSRAAPQSAKTVAFTMPALVQTLQQSLRHPIAADEAERCVRVLADEVLPTWVGIRWVGRVESVAFRGEVRRREWMAKVGELLGE